MPSKKLSSKEILTPLKITAQAEVQLSGFPLSNEDIHRIIIS